MRLGYKDSPGRPETGPGHSLPGAYLVHVSAAFFFIAQQCSFLPTTVACGPLVLASLELLCLKLLYLFWG